MMNRPFARVSTALAACACLSGQVLAASDDCASATPVGEGVFPYDTRNATGDGPNPCSSVGSRNVWFLYTAGVSGNVTASTCASNFGPLDQQSVVAVYSGTCAAPVNITCSFSGCGLGSSATFAAAAGQSYFIQIGGGCPDCTSNGQLAIVNDGTAPANDACTSPTLIGEGVHAISRLDARHALDVAELAFDPERRERGGNGAPLFVRGLPDGGLVPVGAP